MLANKSLFVYYTLIDPFLTYSLISWGNTYPTSLQPLTTLQKKAVRIITFSDFNSHSSPLFRKLGLLKLKDLIYLDSVLFMHYRPPSTFNNFFKALIKYINMQQDWPLRSLIIYRNLGQIMCTAVVLSCFFVYSFVYLFIYYSLNIFSLCVFVCICLFITTLISSYFPA